MSTWKRKWRQFFWKGKGHVGEICVDCGGILILHKRGQCTRSEADKVVNPETMDSLKLQFLD